MAEPFGLVGVFVNVEAGNEGFVAADNDHGQQVGNHHDINQVQYGDHDGIVIHNAEVGDQVPQGFEELTGINDLGDNQAYINRQLQPAAGENEMREDAHSVVGCAFGRGGVFHIMVVCRKDKGRHFNGKIFKLQFERLNLKRKAV